MKTTIFTLNFFLNALFAALIAANPLQAIASSNFYQCIVMSDAQIKNDGSLDVMRNSPRVGEKFTVIKNTGEVIGDVMDTLKKPQVLVLGDEKNSYKVLWKQKASGKNGVFIDYLNINEFAIGQKKPFGFFSGTLMLTGLCE